MAAFDLGNKGLDFNTHLPLPPQLYKWLTHARPHIGDETGQG